MTPSQLILVDGQRYLQCGDLADSFVSVDVVLSYRRGQAEGKVMAQVV